MMLMVTSFAYGIENFYAVKTSVEGGRYEIIQSPIARRVTLKLDKESGDTYLLVNSASKKDDYTWQRIFGIGIISDEGAKEGEINYQIFLSGISMKDCYLVNIHTGKTWQLTDVKDIGYAWIEME